MERTGEGSVGGELDINRLEMGNVMSTFEYLRLQEPGVVIFDSDYTIRRPGEGALGEILPGVMEELRALKDLGWRLVFVTNQPEKGHQIARWMAKKRGHYFFPDSLISEFGKDRVIGGGADFPVRHYKRTGKAVAEVGGKGDAMSNVWLRIT